MPYSRHLKGILQAMNKSSAAFSIWAVFSLVMLGTGCVSSPLQVDPEFANGKRSIRSLAILPPKVLYFEVFADGRKQQQPQKEQHVRGELENKLTSLLKERGYAVQPFILDDAERKLNTSKFMVERMVDRIENEYLSVKIKRLQQQVSWGESPSVSYSIGPVGAALGGALSVDAFLLTSYHAHDRSKGAAALDVTAMAITTIAGGTPVSSKQPPYLEIALIEATTGSILWSNKGSAATPKSLLSHLPAVPATRQ